ncbi:GCC2 and GCC3 family protein (macronuclear) [Tetrahymena thermophila SB210]|uniref:GCC2 and GCC3 family protein n=1 Tax=Tetrahymena thermophila (strain SB210) TaxID=312017 RepID=Q23RP4_TETTS|nr:GCC2 and GCC3 family protein [Tetrahymena thermophila SB210]EAR99193.1 GCC2 and GCC3 family protein [Tetrahymena thermophila SB210]|eukprot:XP_001019438.1 GCC2 and GCC3 family protein [Tetrahymena thermophila SB210]
MKNYITCLLILALIQLSYQYCHYSSDPYNYEDDICNCLPGFYTQNRNCFLCPYQSFTDYFAIAKQASDCSICPYGPYYLTVAATSVDSATCSKCPNNSINFGELPIGVQDESVCQDCIAGYYKIKDAISPSNDNGNKGKAAQCQKCPNNTSTIISDSDPMPQPLLPGTDTLSSTYCGTCAEGFYATSQVSPNQNANCQICPNNTSAINGMDISMKSRMRILQRGFVFPQLTYTSKDCILCLTGFYNAETDRKKPVNCQKCPGNTTTNQVSTNGIFSCTCSLNQYITALPTPTSAATCVPCPTGSGKLYNLNVVGDESTCDVCLEGYYLITPYQDPVGDSPGVGAQCQICPKNSYSTPGTSNSPSSCSLCKPNYYMTKAADSTNSAECQSCPNNTGTLAPVSQVGDATQCTVCVAGYYMTQPYQDGVTAQCQQCPAGSNTNPGINTVCYCYDQYASWSATQNSCQCNPGSVGSPATSLNTQGCTPCPPGQYFSAGVCVDCPAGTYSSSPGSTSCTKCTSGYFATGKGNTSCQTCPNLTVSLDDFTGCKCVDTSAVFVNGNCVCPDGYEGTPSSSSGTQGCNACIAGQFSNSSTSGKCTACPTGKYSQGTGNTNCKQCDINTFASNTGSSSCDQCGSGSTNNADFSGCSCIDSNATQTDSKSSCTCNSGFVGSPKASQSSQSGCTACVAGQEVNIDTGLCSPCAAGRYSSNSANQSCTQCSAGQYASGTGNSSCSSCPSGFSSLDDFSGCKCNDTNAIFANNKCICKQGYGGTPNSAKNGSTGCTICPSGQYSDISTQGQCIACPAGTYSSNTGNSSCTQCSEGQYASGTGNSSCQSCGSTLTNTDDFSGCKCIDLNANKPVSNPSCVCNSGYVGSPATSKNSQLSCTACPAGQFADSGKCSPCGVGTFSSGTANSACTKCLAGQFANGTGNTKCQTCAPGSTSTDDFSGCKCYDQNSVSWNASNNICQCNTNYYGDASKATETQKSQCNPCPNSQTSKAGDAKTEKDCQVPQSQQNTQFSFSQILNVSILIFLIIL